MVTLTLVQILAMKRQKLDELRTLFVAAVEIDEERPAWTFLRRIYSITIEIEEITRSLVH